MSCRPKISSSLTFLLLKLTSTPESVKRFSYRQPHSWVDVTSVNFNSKKVNEDEIFGRQDILQFFSGEFKDYKYVKFPQTLAAL